MPMQLTAVFWYYLGFLFYSSYLFTLTIQTMLSTQSGLTCVDAGTSMIGSGISFGLHPCLLCLRF